MKIDMNLYERISAEAVKAAREECGGQVDVVVDDNEEVFAEDCNDNNTAKEDEDGTRYGNQNYELCFVKEVEVTVDGVAYKTVVEVCYDFSVYVTVIPYKTAWDYDTQPCWDASVSVDTCTDTEPVYTDVHVIGDEDGYDTVEDAVGDLFDIDNVTDDTKKGYYIIRI